MESFRKAIEEVFSRHSQNAEAEKQFRALVRMGEQMHRLLTERTNLAEQRASQVRRLAKQLTQTEQRERSRLAQIIHDDLQQILLAAKVHLKVLRNRVQDEAILPLADQVDEYLHSAISVSRSLTSELCPPILHHRGLREAFGWLAKWAEDNYGLHVEVVQSAEVQLAEPDLLPLLFQVVRELLFNIVKHAKVLSAAILITSPNRQIQIDVVDSGIGFDPADIDGRHGCSLGFGLNSIRERLELMGGRFELHSVPGQGTRATLHVPSAEPAPAASSADNEADGRPIMAK